MAAFYPHAKEQAEVRQALLDALRETQTSIAGTGLLALHRLAGAESAIDKPAVQRAALQLAQDEQCGELARITAVQVCGRMGVKEVAPLALQLAQTAASVPLRIAAVATLGDVGGAAARGYLEELARGEDERLRVAAASALQRLNGRTQ
jgi:HEAT repeat protein